MNCSARCRLFETPEQCDQRYGTPTQRNVAPFPKGFSQDDPSTEVRFYQKGKFIICVCFVDGVAHCLSFIKGSVALSEDDAFQILRANADGRNWLTDAKHAQQFNPAWARDDKRAFARNNADSDIWWGGTSSGLSIFSADWVAKSLALQQRRRESENKQRIDDAQKATKGF